MRFTLEYRGILYDFDGDRIVSTSMICRILGEDIAMDRGWIYKKSLKPSYLVVGNEYKDEGDVIDYRRVLIP